MRVSGLTRKWSHSSVLGLTDTDAVKLDFDNTHFRRIKYWAFRTMKWFKLEGFIVLKSSKDHYHVVFDRKTSWTDNVRIMAWVSLMSHNRSLVKWFIMQCIKQGSTLRVSPKKEKPCPRIVFRSGSQNSQVAEFLKYRTVVKSIIERMQENGKTEKTTVKNKERFLATQRTLLREHWTTRNKQNRSN